MLVLRHETERPEAVKAGTVKIVGTDKRSYIKAARLLTDKQEYDRMANAVNPYGDGRASIRLWTLLYYFGLQEDKPREFCT